MKATISEVRAAEGNRNWFDRKNKKFFNDVGYWTLKGKTSGKTYLVRSTYAWSDMFGNQKRLHYRLNELDQETLKVGHLIDWTFDTVCDVKQWLKNN